MKSIFGVVALILCSVLTVADLAFAATDGIYQLTEVTSSEAWDGTDAVLPQAPTADYDAVFGDDAYLTYTLPASFSGFTFYRQPYSQIAVDTNGNIWFGYAGSAYSFSLPLAGKGPVISAWNSDLSSYAAGGVFIQHKSNPERVVIEWQTETFTDEGSTLLNDFEVVLFADGKIRIDYRDFQAGNVKDFGSGISKDDGTHYLSVTTEYGNVYSLAGRYFQFVDVSQPTNNTLSIAFSGTGSGTVTSTPAGIACNTSCDAQFSTGTQVTLHPAPSAYSLFTGWANGACSGTGDCLLTLNTDTTVTAAFDYDATHQVKINDGTNNYYSSIQSAYNAAAGGATLNLWAISYTETLSCNLPISVTLQGGFDSTYSTIVGDTVLDGSLSITDGTVTTDGLTIK
ncbi:hypothetical protein [Geotalea sp. SG265]|uniref:hypothetical protein n=1 Tax=Geotalea sp. SG265 TaxID=2922867 RepID=UPI001FAFF7F6|nr:hypothetical protein [Geotalea sp. SG265]